MTEHKKTYVLVDGENIDGALGEILGHKPEPAQRPRWQTLVAFAEQHWGQEVRALFFLNATKHLPAPFIQALIATGYRPIPLSGSADVKIVDVAIIRTLEAIADQGGDVILASHDADFVAAMQAVANTPSRVGVVGFPELMSQHFQRVEGLEVFDLEADVKAFESVLPRVRIIPLENYDPFAFL